MLCAAAKRECACKKTWPALDAATSSACTSAARSRQSESSGTLSRTATMSARWNETSLSSVKRRKGLSRTACSAIAPCR